MKSIYVAIGLNELNSFELYPYANKDDAIKKLEEMDGIDFYIKTSIQDLEVPEA